jgi:hypothetical protein
MPSDAAGVDIVIALIRFALNFSSIRFLSELLTWILGYIGALLTPRAYTSKLQLPTLKILNPQY